ncbi:hypothetical protein [Chryseolinea soli]|uniref:hypothetical protein n=1 Tax=Chryseolinea soli TaxID=2321403 RepID=UPI00135A3A49|nr:hypothetical protein [Chryseolinea soli]
MKATLLLLFALLLNIIHAYSQTTDSTDVIHSRSRVFGFPAQESSTASINGLRSSGWWRVESHPHKIHRTGGLFHPIRY